MIGLEFRDQWRIPQTKGIIQSLCNISTLEEPRGSINTDLDLNPN